jgi:ferredoxin
MDIMRFQHERCAGIFACEEAVVVSNSNKAGGVPALQIQPVEVGISQDGFAANTEVFMEAWNAIRDDGRFADFDWTLKVDPDCVMVPDRIRSRLAGFGTGAFYVLNCNSVGLGAPMMFGAVEAISRDAVRAYGDQQDRCKNELGWQGWGEDKYLANCLQHIGVLAVSDFDLLHDQRCLGEADCTNQAPSAFHPFKDMASWAICWEQAAGIDVAPI